MKQVIKSRIMYTKCTFYCTVPCQEAGNTVPGQVMDPALFLSAAESQNLPIVFSSIPFQVSLRIARIWIRIFGMNNEFYESRYINILTIFK
jgi:hypothetical protein